MVPNRTTCRVRKPRSSGRRRRAGRRGRRRGGRRGGRREDGADEELEEVGADEPPAVIGPPDPRPGGAEQSNHVAADDTSARRQEDDRNVPEPPQRERSTESGSPIARTLVAPVGQTADDEIAPAAVVLPQIDAEVSVTAVTPQPVEFRPIRGLVSWVLTLLGYNPHNPGVSPNPFLEAAWALYRRTESLFFNQAPTVGTAEVLDTEVAEDGAVVVTGTLNFSDFNGDPLTFTAAGGQSGTVTVQPDGTFRYVAAPGFTGTDTFTLVADDSAGFHLLSFLQPGGAHTTTATVSITITAVDSGNQAPVVGDPGYAITGINRITGAVRGRVDVTDPDGDTVTYRLDGALDPGVGTVTVDTATGAWTFTPTAEARLAAWRALDGQSVQFTVIATDGVSATAVDVTAVVDPAARYTVDALLGGEQESWGNQGLAIGLDGRIYLTTYLVDDSAGEVVVLNPDGSYATTISLPVDAAHPYASAYDLAVGADGRSMSVVRPRKPSRT
jgi:VCBS repeat-containing protein